MILLALLLSLSARAACPVDTTRLQLTEQVQLARAAFAADERPVLEAATQDTRWTLTCIAEPVSRRDVALVHLVVGLERWDPEAPEAAVPWLKAYAEAFPPAEDARDDLPAGLAEAEREVFARAAPLLEAFEPTRGPRLPPPMPGKIFVDGDTTARFAPADAPYVFQRIAGRRVLQTALVEPGQRRLPYPRMRPVALGSGLALAGTGAALLTAGARVQADLEAWAPGDAIGRQPSEEQYFEARTNLNHGLVVSGTAAAALGAVSLAGFGLSFVF